MRHHLHLEVTINGRPKSEQADCYFQWDGELIPSLGPDLMRDLLTAAANMAVGIEVELIPRPRPGQVQQIFQPRDPREYPNEARGEVKADRPEWKHLPRLTKYWQRLKIVDYLYFIPPVPTHLQQFKWTALWEAIRGRDYVPPTPPELAKLLDDAVLQGQLMGNMGASAQKAAEGLKFVGEAAAKLAGTFRQSTRAIIRSRIQRAVIETWESGMYSVTAEALIDRLVAEFESLVAK